MEKRSVDFLGKVGASAAGCEHGHAATLGDAVSKRELDLRVVELLDASALRVGGGDTLNLDDLDAIGLRAMTSTHVTVALSDGAGHRDVAILAVHVVVAGTRVITQPDAKVFDAACLALLNLQRTRRTMDKRLIESSVYLFA